jgi:hypothetical protein
LCGEDAADGLDAGVVVDGYVAAEAVGCGELSYQGAVGG